MEWGGSYLAGFELGFKIPLSHAKLNSSPCLHPCQVGSRGTFQIQVQPAGQFQRSAGQVVAEKTHRSLLPPRGPGRTQRLLSVQELATPTHTTEQELKPWCASAMPSGIDVVTFSVMLLMAEHNKSRTKDAIRFYQTEMFHGEFCHNAWSQTCNVKLFLRAI